MITLGITGRSGCGKSTATAVFTAHGVPLVDADQISREILLPGSPLLPVLAQRFGADILYARSADIPFRSDSFDEVFVTRHTATNCQDDALHEIFRVLRPGGQVIVATRGMRVLFTDSEYEMDKRTVMRALQSAGFSDVSWRNAGLCGVIIGWKKRLNK